MIIYFDEFAYSATASLTFVLYLIFNDQKGKLLSKSLQKSRRKKKVSTQSWFQLIKKFNMSTFTTMDLNNNLPTTTTKRWATTYRGPSPKTAKGGWKFNRPPVWKSRATFAMQVKIWVKAQSVTKSFGYYSRGPALLSLKQSPTYRCIIYDSELWGF